MFRFTLREVVLFFALVAVTACWAGDRWRMAYTVEKYRSQARYFAYLLKSDGYPVEIDE